MPESQRGRGREHRGNSSILSARDLAQHLPHTGEGRCLPSSLLSVGMPGLLSACGLHVGVARFREPQWLSVVSEPLQ